MIPTGLVKASVVDIRPGNALSPKSGVVDANILYIIGYDFTSFMAAGVRLPPPYQTRFYPAWWKKAIKEGVTFCTTAGVLAEVAHIVERTELEILWRTDPNRPELDPALPGQDFTPKYIKTVRHYYFSQLQALRESVDTTLKSIRKLVNVMPQVGQDAQAFDQTLVQWVPSAADFGDAALVASAKRMGMTHIISDDADLISFDGITVYTANRKAIDAAVLAGKLVS
jgi:predicted nucleic acid-binding protein